MVSYISHFLTKGEIPMRERIGVFLAETHCLMLDELTRSATKVLFYRIGPLLSQGREDSSTEIFEID
jgi:hypothetical protein